MNYHTFLSFHGFNMTSQVDNVDWFPITSGTYKYINNLVKTSNANWLHFLLWISDFFFAPCFISWQRSTTQQPN
jgi:hypothetical protein